MKETLKSIWEYIKNNLLQILCAVVFAAISIFKDFFYKVLKIEPTIIAIALFLLYVIFSLIKEHKKASYTELHKIQNICLRSEKDITSISQYIIDKGEKNLPEKSEVHIITNDLEHWDLLDIGFENIAENMYTRSVTYVYYLPNSNAHINNSETLKQKIIDFLKAKHNLSRTEIENNVKKHLQRVFVDNENDLLYNFVVIIEPNGNSAKVVRGDWYLSDQKIGTDAEKINNHVLTVDIRNNDLDDLVKVFKRLAKGKIKDSLIQKC